MILFHSRCHIWFLQVLESLKPHDESCKKTGLLPENIGKNRDTEIIPSNTCFIPLNILYIYALIMRAMIPLSADRFRPILTTVGRNRTDYINAVVIPVKSFTFVHIDLGHYLWPWIEIIELFWQLEHVINLENNSTVDELKTALNQTSTLFLKLPKQITF